MGVFYFLQPLLLENTLRLLLRFRSSQLRAPLVWIGRHLPLEVAASFLLDVHELTLDGWPCRTIGLAAVLVAEWVVASFDPDAVEHNSIN